MTHSFRTDAELPLPPMVHASGCGCPLHARRRVGAALAVTLGSASLLPGPAQAQQPSVEEGVRSQVGGESRFAQMVSAEQVEMAASKQYGQMKREAATKKALASDDNPQLIRLRAIGQRVIPFCQAWNPRAAQWRWEVSLIGSNELNAFCMPGGKIAFYYGILKRLQLSDDEVAMIMGHEMAHALREHAREQMGKTAATRMGAGLISSLFGFGNLGDTMLNMGAQLLTLRFSREDETEADLVGLELAARAGYDPRAGIGLWNKMTEANKGAPPQFLSTHPASPTRIAEIERALPRVLPIYDRAPKPPKFYGPPVA